MAPPRPVLHVHLGAQKTATTHIQETLALSAAALEARGVRYAPLDVCRDRISPLLNLRRSWRAWVGGPPLRRRVFAAAGFDPSRHGTLLLSEENWAGRIDTLFAERPFENVARRVSVLARLAGQGGLRLFFAVRSYDAVAESAYIETLKIGPHRIGREAARSAVMASRRGWFEVLGDIRAAAPGAALTVWRYEDYAPRRLAILEALSGVGGVAFPEPPPARVTPPLTMAAVEAAEALDPALAPRDWNDAAKATLAEPRPEGPRYALFDEAERAALRARYAADLARIDAAWPAMRLRVDAAAAPQAAERVR